MVQYDVQEYEIQAVVSQKDITRKTHQLRITIRALLRVLVARGKVYGMVQDTRDQIPFS